MRGGGIDSGLRAQDRPTGSSSTRVSAFTVAALLTASASTFGTTPTPRSDGPRAHKTPAAAFVRSGAQQQVSLGSVVPCAVPLPWRLGPVDRRFGIDPVEAREAVRDAARLWEGVVGRELFRHDPDAGFPVTFEFDDRQAMLELRTRFRTELQTADDELGLRAAELNAMNVLLEATQTEYEERVRDLNRSTEEYNERVQEWNRQGGAPARVRSDLQRQERILAMERRSVQEAGRELREVQERLRAEVERLNRSIGERNRRAEAFQRDDSPVASESGRYLESVRTRNGEVVSVEREIRVFRFDGREELVLVIAHELGHALGLGHAGESGAVMSDVLPSPAAFSGEPGPRPRDVEMLSVRCPEL